MDRVLRLHSTDERITYDPDWKTTPNSGVGQNGTYSLASSAGRGCFFLFRGTSVRFYGRLGGGGGSLTFDLDGSNTGVLLNGTNFDNGPTLVWSNDTLGDDDHRLSVYIYSLQQNGSVAVDYFEVENSSGNGFDPLWAGPNATNIPKEAIIVDNTSPDVVYSHAWAWMNSDSARYYRSSLSYAMDVDGSLIFSFDGVAIWYYGDLTADSSTYTASIDGAKPERLNDQKYFGLLNQQMLWSKTDLTPGRHTLTLNGPYLNLDFFRVLRANVPSALPSSTTPESKSNIMPLAVGLSLGLFTLVIVVLGAVYLWRRKPALVKAPSTVSLKP